MSYHASDYVENYYDLLAIPMNATTETITQALSSYRLQMEERVKDLRQMTSARRALNEIIPDIRRHLLSGEIARAEYDRRLLSQQQRNETDEPADDEGLDDILEQRFYFDLFNSVGTEYPASTLREIAMKFDREWPVTYNWLKNSSRDINGLVGYLIYGIGRHRLAQRIVSILEKSAEQGNQQGTLNEAIERCIYVLDPEIERPEVGLQGPSFDGSTYMFLAGDLPPDKTARVELGIYHGGLRGCAFGTVKTRSDWVTFADGATQKQFALMPPGTNPATGVTQETLPLLLHVERLQPYADYTAELVVCQENFDPALEVPLYIYFRLLARPPRVVFDPDVRPGHPLRAGIVKRGALIKIPLRVKNMGDEARVPLLAQISPPHPLASATPARFHANDTITLSLNTASYANGQSFEVQFPIDYSPTKGAVGPAFIPLQWAIYPTFWQSLQRHKRTSQRIASSLFSGIALSVLFFIASAWIASRAAGWWLCILCVLAICVFMARLLTRTFIAHARLTGDSNIRPEAIAAWIRWGAPIAYGLVTIVVILLMSNIWVASLLSALAGLLAGCFCGFTVDKAHLPYYYVSKDE